MTESADMINRLEIVRKQLEDQLKANAGQAPLEKALKDLDRKALDVELRGRRYTVYAKAENLNLKMRQLIREQQRKDLDDVMGIGQRRPTVRQAMKVLEDGGTWPVLAVYANRPNRLRG